MGIQALVMATLGSWFYHLRTGAVNCAQLVQNCFGILPAAYTLLTRFQAHPTHQPEGTNIGSSQTKQ